MNYNYIAVVPNNQIIYNTPYHQKQFSSIGVRVEDTPLDTILPIVANDEEFKAPSSKAVYEAIKNLRDTTVQVDYLNTNININNPNNDITVPTTTAVINALNDLVIQNIQDDVIDKVVSSEALFEALKDLTTNQIQMVQYDFPIPTIEWIVNHNRNTMMFQEAIFDQDNNKVFAAVNIIDSNNFKISFTEATSGFIIVKF